MKREEALRIIKECKEKGFKHTFYTLNEYHTALDIAIKALEQELLCDRLAREYISKVKYCDECFSSTFCTINSLRNSRVPQSYCIENIKKYFESKSEDKE